MAAYNPDYLRAVETRVSVNLVDNNKLLKSLFKCYNKSVSNEELSLFPNREIFFSHKIISLVEAVSLSDKRKKRTICSSKCEYVNARQERRLLVKKVRERTPTSFKSANSDENFELINTNINRHFTRRNGADIILAESVVWYDYVGTERSRELAALYSSIQIPASEIKSVVNPLIMLPKVLLCQNGDVLQIRNKKKILIYPISIKEHFMMYTRCLLFHPLKLERGGFKKNSINLGKVTNLV